MNDLNSKEIDRVTYIQWHNERKSTKNQFSSSTSDRYFHLKLNNLETHKESDDIEIIEHKNEDYVETPEFLKRKTTLLSRIFRSKYENQTPENDKINEDTKKETKFFEDFIPLDVTPTPMELVKETNDINKKYSPKLTITNYNGPYSIDCLNKARKSLIESFKPVTKETIYSDRTFEILKIKLKVPSKFDGDKRLIRRLNNKKHQYLNNLNEKLRLTAKLSVRNLEKNQQNKSIQKNKHTYISDDNNSDAASFVSDYSYDKNEKKNQEKFKLKKNSNVYFNLYEDKEDKNNTSDNDVQIIENSNDSVEEIVDSDSKCRQFDKYRRLNEPKSKRVNTMQVEINELEEKYRAVRDQRNKLTKNMKKKKKTNNNLGTDIKTSNNSGVDLNTKREALFDEMKKLRSNLKKLRKNSRVESRRNYKQRKKVKF